MFSLGGKAPQGQTTGQVTVLLVEKARDGGEAPVLIRLMELSSRDASCLEPSTELFELRFVARRQVDVRGMVVGRATVEIGVFKGGVTGLNGLLREREIAAGDGVEIGLAGNLLHDVLRLVDETVFVFTVACFRSGNRFETVGS